MGFSYLNGKNWNQITREERFFCAAFFDQFKSNPVKFIKWLNENSKLKLDITCEWEIGYEVCFYRDLLKELEENIKASDFSQKRTFDLCLFSEKTIIVIEAKCQQGFKKKQVEDFKKDKKQIPKATKTDTKVKLIGLASSKYYQNLKKFGKSSILKSFEDCISWKDLFDSFENPIYLQADNLYKK